MFNWMFKPFQEKKGIEIVVEIQPEQVVEPEQIPTLWEKVQEQTLMRVVEKQVEDQLALSCYTKEEIDDTKALKDFIKKVYNTQGIKNEAVDERYGIIYFNKDSTFAENLIKKFPKAQLQKNKYESTGYSTWYYPALRFDSNKLKEKIVDNLKAQLNEFEKSKKNP